jgi:AraC-like DNA-binding protein
MRARLLQGLSVGRFEIARELHVSERTLQRQLARESLTFMALWNQVRAEMSRELLANAGLGVEAVPHSVGFVEVASFSRAFARWTGCSPGRYRAALAERPSPRRTSA